MDDEAFYEAVAVELEQNGPRKGLWAKCFAKSCGNDSAAKALYIEQRVAELKEAVAGRTEQERRQRERQAQIDAEIERAHQAEAAREADSAAVWRSFAEKLRALGMNDQENREHLASRGLAKSVVDRIVRNAFNGERREP